MKNISANGSLIGDSASNLSPKSTPPYLWSHEWCLASCSVQPPLSHCVSHTSFKTKFRRAQFGVCLFFPFLLTFILLPNPAAHYLQPAYEQDLQLKSLWLYHTSPGVAPYPSLQQPQISSPHCLISSPSLLIFPPFTGTKQPSSCPHKAFSSAFYITFVQGDHMPCFFSSCPFF